MSWLDDVPVGNDDHPAYDPTQPIEREFVLAPAWRAFKARVSGIFKRSDVAREEQYSPTEEPSTARILEPEFHPIAEPGRIKPTHPLELDSESHQPATAAHEEFQPASEQELQPFAASYQEVPTYSKRPSRLEKAGYFASVPTAESEIAVVSTAEMPVAASQVMAPESAAPASEVSVPDPVSVPVLIGAPISRRAERFLSSPAVRVTSVPVEEIVSSTHIPIADAAATELAGKSTIVAAAVRLDSWVARRRAAFSNWKTSNLRRRANPQQELFATPKQTKRDQVWLQTTVAAAALAIAFLMGWMLANSKRPASSADDTMPATTETRSNTAGTTLSPTSVAKPAGVTVQAGGATLQAGGVTLLSSSNASTSTPASNPAIPAAPKPSAKPSPARSSARAASHGHLRRSIDPAGDEVVVRHYAVKPNAVAQKQTAQVKQYSDIN